MGLSFAPVRWIPNSICVFSWIVSSFSARKTIHEGTLTKMKSTRTFEPSGVPMIAKTLFNAKIFLSVMAVFFFSWPAHAQTPQPPDPPAGFDKIEQMVPMRDGVKLHTIIYAPKSHREALPILFNRTPYGIDNIYRAFPGGSLKEEIDEGYIFAFQDIRGRFKSEGQFVMQRPPH